MEFRITEEQEMLFSTIRMIMKKYCPESYMKECNEKHLNPKQLTDALTASGFGMLGVPKEYGGIPCDITTLIIQFFRSTGKVKCFGQHKKTIKLR